MKYGIGAVVLLALLGLAGYWIFPEFIAGIWALFRATWIVIVPMVIAIIVGFLLIGGDEHVGAGVLIGALGIAWLFVGGTMVNYQQDAKLSESLVVAEDSPNTVEFRDRAPYDVAVATSNRTLGDTTGDATGVIQSLPSAGDHGEYTTSVVRRGVGQGYESTQTLTPPLFGSATSKDVRFCDFDEDAELRFGGAFFHNNLDRAVIHETGINTKVNRDDAFVVCDQGTPMVYAPVTTQKGFAITQRVPAGVVTYNGKTGDMKYEKDYKGPLPVYPSSVTEKQRESLTAMDGFGDWIFNRAGWETTEADADDPNGETRAEFGLSDPKGNTHSYVTPLTPRGDSTSIVAMGVSKASEMKAGELNDYTVYKYPQGESRQANSSIAASITGEVLGGYKAQGLSVFEIVPSSDGKWVASIGKDQSILYRAYISEDGSIKLNEAQEAPETGKKAEDAGKVDLAKPVEEMTPEELTELGDQILKELASRSEG